MLGLFVRLTVINHYSDIGIIALEQGEDTPVWILLNCGARQHISKFLEPRASENLKRDPRLVCVIDMNRPFDRQYVLQAMENMAARASGGTPSSEIVHIYMTEEDLQATKLRVFDVQEADNFCFETPPLTMSRITQCLVGELFGEYKSSPAALVCLEAIAEQEGDTHIEIMAAAVALAQYVLIGELSINRYCEWMLRLQNLRKFDPSVNIAFETDFYLPLLYHQPLKRTIGAAVLSLGDKHLVDDSHLRIDLEMTKQNWEETPCRSVLVRLKKQLVSGIRHHVLRDTAATVELPLVSVDTAVGRLSSFDFAALIGYNLNYKASVSHCCENRGSVECVKELRNRLHLLTETNVWFLAMSEMLSWLRRPGIENPRFPKMLRRLQEAQEESVVMIARMLTHRSRRVFGMRGTFEGFFEDGVPDVLFHDFCLSRMCFTVSRLVSGSIEEEQLSHVVFGAVSGVNRAALFKCFLAFPDRTRPSRISIGLHEVLVHKVGEGNFRKDFVNSSIICLSADVARKSFRTLFPRKRMREPASKDKPVEEVVVEEEIVEPKTKKNKRTRAQ